MPAVSKKATPIDVLFTQLLLTFLFLTGTTHVMSQDADKPAKKNEAFAVNYNLNSTKEYLADHYGFMVHVPQEEIAHYSALLHHMKYSDSATISKLALPDKFLVLGVRNVSDIGELRAMDEEKITEFIFKNDLDYPAYFKDLTIGNELFLSSASTKTRKLFKADLLYKEKVIGEKVVVTIIDDEKFYLPAGEFRSLFFKMIIAPAIKASGQSEDEYLTAMILQLPPALKRTSLWNADKSSEYYSNGVLKSVMPYRNGKIDGIVTGYFANGILRSTTEYTDGMINGKMTEYYVNNVIKSTATYTNGKMNGTVTTYYYSGIMESTKDYTNDEITGLSKNYDENGKLKSTRIVVNNKTFSSYYNTTGILEETYEITNNEQGQQIGFSQSKAFYPSGILSREGGFGNFGAEGNWKFYDEKGILTGEQEFRIGKKNGKGKDYYPDGRVKAEYVYEMGNLQSEKKF